jgi:hypothetical protein
MYKEDSYKVESITRTADGKVFEAWQHIRSGLGKYRHIEDIEVPENVDLEVGDVVRVRIENHSDESGRSKSSWALDRFIGFPYEKERGWSPLDGL